MSLKQIYPAAATAVGNVSINIVVIPGIGLPPPTDWESSSGNWLKKLQEFNGEHVRILHYEYTVIADKPIWQTIVNQSYSLQACLHQLNPKNSTCRPIILVCHSLGGCIWKQAYFNMTNKRYEHNNILDHIGGTMFLGTPHLEDASRLNFNIVEIIVRTGSAQFSAESFQSDDNKDNESIARISRGFIGLESPIISTFETIESKYRWIRLKGQFGKSCIIVSEELVKSLRRFHLPIELYGVPSSHENQCKLDVGGEVFTSITRMIQKALQQFLHSLELRENYSAVDSSGLQSLRSHRSRMVQPRRLDALLQSGGDVHTTLTQPVGQLLKPSSMDSKLNSKTPSATAGDSSQFSFEMVPSADHLETLKLKLRIPCFSVGSRTRKVPFHGRTDVLRLIDENLCPEDPVQAVSDGSTSIAGNLKTFALCGAGGLGKTELASEYIFTRKDKYSVILWATADTRNSLLEDFARMATDLGLQQKEEAQDLGAACELLKGWFCNPVRNLEVPLQSAGNEVSWLLVLDNVDNWATIEDLWPTTGIGSILITSRDPYSGKHIYTTQRGEILKPLSFPESMGFLETITHKHSRKSPESAKAIANLTGGLPLLITAIARTMFARNLDYDAMLQLLQKRGFDVVESHPQTRQAESAKTASIASAIGLESLDEHTLGLIRVMSFLKPESVPRKLFKSTSQRARLLSLPRTQAELITAESKLQQASLVSFNDENETFHMHRIFQDIVRGSMSPETRVKSLVTALQLVSEAWVFQPLEHRFNTDRYEKCSSIFAHVDSIYHYYEELFRTRKIEAMEQAAALFNDAGWYWFERGFPQESKSFCRLAQSICDILLQTQPSKEVSKLLRESHNNQGSAANETNDPDESLKHNLKWLDLMKERTTDNGQALIDYELGCAYNEVGVSYAMNGIYTLAHEFFQRSISTYKSLPDYDEKWLGWPLPNIGMVFWVQGKYTEALEALHHMRTIYETAYGRDDRQSFKTGKVLYGIGNVYLSLGDLDLALDYHTRAFGQWTETLGGSHHRIGDVSHKIAQVLMSMGKFQEAQHFLTRAFKIFSRRQYHTREYIRTMFRQGQLYQASGRPVQAEQSFRTACKQRQGLKDHLNDLRQWHELGEEDYDELVIYMSR